MAVQIKDIGKELRARRTKGLRAVAKEIGVSPTTLSRIENGKLPDLSTYFKICNWMKVDAETIKDSFAFCPHCGEELPKR